MGYHRTLAWTIPRFVTFTSTSTTCGGGGGNPVLSQNKNNNKQTTRYVSLHGCTSRARVNHGAFMASILPIASPERGAKTGSLEPEEDSGFAINRA